MKIIFIDAARPAGPSVLLRHEDGAVAISLKREDNYTRVKVPRVSLDLKRFFIISHPVFVWFLMNSNAVDVS